MYAIVKDGLVVNIVVWDGDSSAWQPPEDSTAIEVTDQTGGAYVGCAYTDGRFVAPIPKTTT